MRHSVREYEDNRQGLVLVLVKRVSIALINTMTKPQTGSCYVTLAVLQLTV